MKTSVSVGATSIIGWLYSILGMLPTIIKSVEEGSVAWTQADKWLAISAIAVGAITQIGRYAQAHGLIKAGKAA
jgi:hypothetical protein